MKKTSGIALITLVITVLMLSIITGAGIGIGLDSLNVKNINNLYTDIKILNDSVAAYYNQYGVLPLKEKFTGNYEFATDRNPNDDPDNYYVIDINKLGNITLTSDVKWKENDVYVINQKTHTIYYPEGIKHDDENYYRLPGEYSLIVGMDIVMSYQPETLTNGDVVLSVAWPDNTDGFTKEVSIDGGNTWYAYTGEITIVENCTAMARVRDTLGATIAEEAVTIMNIDKINPAAPTIAGGGTNWSNSVTITVTGADSDIQYYEYYISTTGIAPTETTTATGKIGTTTINTTKTINDRNYEGAYIYIRAVDDANNKGSWSKPQMLNIDIDKPTISIKPDGKTGYVMPSTGTATIKTSATADDNGGSGLATLYYAWSQNETSSPTATSAWTSFTNGATISKIDITEPGTWYLWVRVTDGAGNITETRSGAFVIGSNTDEKNSIKFEPQIEAETWTNDPVDVKVNFGENVQNNQTITVTGTEGTDYIIDKETNTVTILTNNQTITVTATDSEGNKVEASYTVDNIDLVQPTIVVNPATGNFVMPSSGAATITTTVTASDEGGSGLATLKYAWNGSSTIPPADENLWTMITSGTEVTKNDITGASTWYLWLRATDGAGNLTEEKSGAFVVGSGDSVENQITFIPDVNENTWTSQSVNVQVSFGANLINSQTIAVTGTAGTDYTINKETNTVTILTNNQTITASAADAQGNSVTASYVVSNIDPYSPIVEGITNVTLIAGETESVDLADVFDWSSNGPAPITSVQYTIVDTGQLIIGSVTLDGGTYTVKCKVTKATGLSAETTTSVLIVTNGTLIPDGQEVPSQYVARIGNVYYLSLHAAVAAVPTDNIQTTVVLMKDVEDYAVISENQNVLIELGGNTVSYTDSATIVNYGTAIIKNGTVTSSEANAIANFGTMELPEGLTLSSNATNRPTVATTEGSTLDITGANITATDGNAVQNEGGIVNVSGNTAIVAGDSWGIHSSEAGIVTISSGTITNTEVGKAVYNSGGTLTIQGTTQINGAVANEDGGTVNMTGGTLEATITNGLVNEGTMNISGTAKVNTTNLPAIFNYSPGTLNITGGTLTSQNTSIIENQSQATISGDVVITKTDTGTTTNQAVAVANRAGATLTVSGGTISAQEGNAIENAGNLIVNGDVDISNTGTASVGAIENLSTGTATITDGTITVTETIAIVNNGTMEISGETEITTTETENYAVYNGGTITISGGIITSEYNSVIGNAGTATIADGANLICNSTTNYTVVNAEELNITGGTITAENVSMIRNGGTLNISGTANLVSKGEGASVVSNNSGATTTITGGTLTATSGNIVSNNGTMEIGGTAKLISLEDTTNYLAIANQSTGVMTISGGTYELTHTMGLYNKGEMSITDPITITTSSSNNTAIYNVEGATLTITEKITFTGITNIVTNYGNLNIEGGAVLHTTGKGSPLVNETTGVTVINGGIITAEATNTILNMGTLTIEGTTQITSTGAEYPTLWNASGDTVINGGTIQNTADGYAIYKAGGTVTVNGGTIITKTNLAEGVLGATETVLTENSTSDRYIDMFFTFTVPSGVTVLKIDMSYWKTGNLWSSLSIGRGYDPVAIDFEKEWATYPSSKSSQRTLYVGVTPGKKYEVGVWCAAAHSVRFSYSSEINKVTPTVTDY